MHFQVGDNMLAPVTLDMPGACGSSKMKKVYPPIAVGDIRSDNEDGGEGDGSEGG